MHPTLLKEIVASCRAAANGGPSPARSFSTAQLQQAVAELADYYEYDKPPSRRLAVVKQR